MVELKTFDEYPDLFKPKRFSKYVLLWCTKGELTILVDEKELSVKQHEILTITSGQVHYVKELKNATGVVLTFPLYFFCKDDNDIELIFHNGLFCHFELNEVIPIKNYAAIETQLQYIKEELEKQPYQYLISIRSRIELLLVTINREKVDRGDEIWKPGALFLKFLEAVRANFEHNYTLAQYAKLLSTTELKLNEQAKMHTGKTAQNVIYGLVISEAKRLLTYENLSVKEVAYKLGFNDPFYFSNFFKKHALISPKTYQSENAL